MDRREKISSQVRELLEIHQDCWGADRLEQWLSLQNEILQMEGTTEAIRRLRFFAYELQALCKELQGPEQKLERAELLRRMFFEKWRFHCTEQVGKTSLLMIGQALETRECHPILLGLLYKELGTHCDLEVDTIQVAERTLIKLSLDGRGQYIDPFEPHRYLDCEDLIEILHDDPREQAFQPMSLADLVLCWLNLHSKYFSGQISSEQMVLIYDVYLTIAPNDLRCLRRRGRLFFDLQLERQAWYDLQRYFLRADPQRIPEDIQSIYRYLKDKFATDAQQTFSAPQFTH